MLLMLFFHSFYPLILYYNQRAGVLFINTCTCVNSFFTNTLILPTINGPTEGLMLIYVSHLSTFLTGNTPPPPKKNHIEQLICSWNYSIYCSQIRACTTYVCSPNLGAEWWAQDFRKSLPFFGWIPLPFLSGMYCRNYQIFRYIHCYLWTQHYIFLYALFLCCLTANI
jgi:hypothetical protein